jgi:hypothetical protein
MVKPLGEALGLPDEEMANRPNVFRYPLQLLFSGDIGHHSCPGFWAPN